MYNTAADIMHSPVPTIAARASFAQATQALLRADIGCLLVPPEAGHSEWGIVTKTDLLEKVFARSRNPWQLRVTDVMTTSVLTVEATTLLEECIALLVERRVERLVVFDGYQPVGVLYAAVVVAALEERSWRSEMAPARWRTARKRISHQLSPYVSDPERLADQILAELNI